jgi:hypothetical protein
MYLLWHIPHCLYVQSPIPFHYLPIPKEITAIECGPLRAFDDNVCIIVPVILSVLTGFCIYYSNSYNE